MWSDGLTAFDARRTIMTESPISLQSLRKSCGTHESAVGLPPSAYTDPGFHDFEIGSVFGSEWLCVGRQEQIPNPGDYLAVTRAQEPLLIVRSGSGSISAMSGVCQHRGMCL
ncbi:MAG TPA: hypothetical protein DCE75_03260, partial [Acidimicrobiaceae bacterium]|nr:hypothetical protein [Acidimicrobiaceae bacterium]